MASGIVEQPSSQSSSETQQPTGGGARSQLVQRLLMADNLPAFIHDLLEQQAAMVAGTEAAGFIIERTAEGPALRPIDHIRRDTSNQETRAAAIKAFADLIKPCVDQGKDGAIEVGAPNDAAESQFCLITLLRTESETVAASAVITRCINLERARQRLMSMQLVAGYFELFTLRRTSEQARMIAQSHQHVLQLATAAATAEGFVSAAMNLCNELAARSGATRVSIGWLKGRNVKVVALSHTEEFDKKQELIVTLQKVMEECLDQDEIVQFDPGGQSSQNVTREAQVLSRGQGGHVVLSLPLRRRNEVCGVATLEFLPDHELGPNVASGLSVAVDLLAPQLYDRYQNDRWLITKTGISIRETAKKAIGPKYMIGKLVAVGIILALLIVTFYKPMYHVSAKFEFVPKTQYTISAPFEGVLHNIAPAPGKNRVLMPGDQVKKGQLLLVMDVDEMTLQRNAAAQEANEKRAEAEKARGEGDTATAKAADFAAAKAEADADYYDDQINRGHVVSPIDGTILSGDLEKKVGLAIKPEDELFVVGQPQNLQAKLSVNERDIQDVRDSLSLPMHGTGTLATDSLPGGSYDFKISRIVPNGHPEDGASVFDVYADVSKIEPTWQPGMQGEARVNIEDRRLAWIWTHRLVDFLRLRLWM